MKNNPLGSITSFKPVSRQAARTILEIYEEYRKGVLRGQPDPRAKCLGTYMEGHPVCEHDCPDVDLCIRTREERMLRTQRDLQAAPNLLDPNRHDVKLEEELKRIDRPKRLPKRPARIVMPADFVPLEKRLRSLEGVGRYSEKTRLTFCYGHRGKRKYRIVSFLTPLGPDSLTALLYNCKRDDLQDPRGRLYTHRDHPNQVMTFVHLDELDYCFGIFQQVYQIVRDNTEVYG